jgi:hypothetical protein
LRSASVKRCCWKMSSIFFCRSAVGSTSGRSQGSATIEPRWPASSAPSGGGPPWRAGGGAFPRLRPGAGGPSSPRPAGGPCCGGPCGGRGCATATETSRNVSAVGLWRIFIESPLGGPQDSSCKSSMGADTDCETNDSTCLSNCASDSAAVGCRGEAAGGALPAGPEWLAIPRTARGGSDKPTIQPWRKPRPQTATNNMGPDILRGFIRFAKHPRITVSMGIPTTSF